MKKIKFPIICDIVGCTLYVCSTLSFLLLSRDCYSMQTFILQLIGIVILFIGVYYGDIKRVEGKKKQTWMTATCVCGMTCMLVNYPIRYWIYSGINNTVTGFVQSICWGFIIAYNIVRSA